MRKLVLLAIAPIFLLFAAYYFEYQEKNLYPWSQLKESEVEFIRLGRHQLIKRDGKFYMGSNDQLVDDRKIAEVWQLLGSILIQRELPSDIPLDRVKGKGESLEIFSPAGKIKMILGAKLPFGRSFYLRIEGKKSFWAVARIEGQGIYMRDEWTEEALIHFRQLLGQSDQYFLDKRIPTQSNLLSLSVNSQRNPRFEILFSSGKVIPNGPVGSYALALSDYQNKIENLEGLNVHKVGNLENYVSTVVIKYLTKIETWKLYKKHNGQNGYFLNLGKKVYELSKDRAQIFFAHHTDFWKKSLNLKRTTGQLSLSDGKNKETFSPLALKDGKFFSAKMVETIIMCLTGAGPFRQARRLIEKIPALQNSQMRVNWGGNIFFFSKDSNVLKVWEKGTQNLFEFLVPPGLLENL